jgi:hypothetical protein
MSATPRPVVERERRPAPSMHVPAGFKQVTAVQFGILSAREMFNEATCVCARGLLLAGMQGLTPRGGQVLGE